MIDLSNLKSVYVKDENSRVPLICVTESSVTFGIGAIKALKSPAYAKVVFDEGKRSLYLFGCSETDGDAFGFLDKADKKYVRLKSAALHSVCNRLSGRSSSDYPYRAKGTMDSLSNGSPVICFDMSKAYKGNRGDQQ